GYTLRQIFKLFATNDVCTEEELWDAAANHDFQYEFLGPDTLGDKYRLEGFLFPDTYTFYKGDQPARVINKMLVNFNEKFKAEYITRAAELGYSVRDIINIAAMIEREAGDDDDDRDMIASVIYNRLNSNSLKRLQIDATIHYAIAETGEAFSKEVDSPYNTYKVEGLPAVPIANPGMASIRAALYPQKSGYYYYALNKQGTHNFFRDYDAHQAFVQSDKYGG
ncbi:MAG: endolytic transglycosylase MltG, partial [Clostridiales bacterium]|nr:endolytic transglycosylase MltG [Clostridiales bacterium]